MGIGNGGMIVDTLPHILDHSWFPQRIHLVGNGYFSFNVEGNVEWTRDKLYSSAFQMEDNKICEMGHLKKSISKKIWLINSNQNLV
jgi:hypothetical protein